MYVVIIITDNSIANSLFPFSISLILSLMISDSFHILPYPALVHLVIMIISPGTLLAVVYFPAVPACLVSEVRVIYPFFSVLFYDCPGVWKIDSAFYLVYVVTEQLSHYIEGGSHAVAVAVSLGESLDGVGLGIFRPLPSSLIPHPY